MKMNVEIDCTPAEARAFLGLPDVTGLNDHLVEEMKKSANPDIKRFLGEEADSTIGADLGLPKDWAVQIIKAVGNYGESFERNVGEGSPLKIARGLNGLWTKGGLQYAPPIR